MAYFNQFPKIRYDISNTKGKNGYQVATNIFFRVGILNSIKSNTLAYYPYIIQDGERPDTLAEKVYGDPYLHWIIAAANDMIDVLADWPMDSQSFQRHIVSEYGGIAQATSSIHHYTNTITRTVGLTDNVVTLEVDAATYASLPVNSFVTYNTTDDHAVQVATAKNAVSFYEWETTKNLDKRNIKLIRPVYVPQIINEFSTLSRQAVGKPFGYRTMTP